MDKKNYEPASGIMFKYQKKHSASEVGIAFNIIKKKYLNAIEYRGVINVSRGILTLLALICLVMMTSAVHILLPIGGKRGFSLFDFVMDSCFVLAMAAFTVYFVVKCVRMELFRPEDEPVIFDRANRSVYRIFREIQPGWRGLFKPWPVRIKQYNWDLVNAEHHAAINANAATISRIHTLVFVVRASSTNPGIVDGFTLGNSLQMGETTVSAMYEHIRRFMEEGGAHLPSGETLAENITSTSLIDCMVRMGPYGKTLKFWWEHLPVLTILGFIFFPLIFPLLTLLGLFSWLSYATAKPVRWPESVLTAVGTPLGDPSDCTAF